MGLLKNFPYGEGERVRVMKYSNCMTVWFAVFAYILFTGLNTIVVAENLSSNVLSVLNNPFTMQKVGSHNGPPDISYLFADLKFDGKSLKVCEFGQATRAGCPLSKVIINDQEETLTSPYWGGFWNYLKGFKVPVWYVGDQKKIEIWELLHTRGHYAESLRAIKKDPLFKKIRTKKRSLRANHVGFAGVVVLGHDYPPRKMRVLKKQSPGILFVNDRTGRFASNKNLMNPLFAHLGLTDYKPRCGLYSKKYSPDLTQKIKDDLKADLFIIKPINSQQSRGVIMIQAQDLNDTLRLILSDSQSLQTAEHRSLQYWSTDTNDSFIVEQYVPSKSITVDGKEYDPTMRLVFCLQYERGLITLHVIGGFWKIPLKPLDEPGTLTEHHVTIPFAGEKYVGIPISPCDMHGAKELLAAMLVPLYSHILDLTA